MQNSDNRIIIGISGASGVTIGVTALRMVSELGLETHLVVTKPGEVTLKEEMGITVKDICHFATYTHKINDITACISSGTFKVAGMLIAPCSIKTMSEITYGHGDNLLARAADVQLKERRTLVVMPRETPVHAGHLKAMLQLCEMGAVIMPPVPAFYTRPADIDDIVTHLAARALGFLGVDVQKFVWEGLQGK